MFPSFLVSPVKVLYPVPPTPNPSSIAFQHPQLPSKPSTAAKREVLTPPSPPGQRNPVGNWSSLYKFYSSRQACQDSSPKLGNRPNTKDLDHGHSKYFEAVVKASCGFFRTTPVPIILSAASKHKWLSKQDLNDMKTQKLESRESIRPFAFIQSKSHSPVSTMNNSTLCPGDSFASDLLVVEKMFIVRPLATGASW
ncbi:hypothetical protein llap_5344 [Limosa lapponica baueri]|uniref:Uncharacterized protein n=1 Tax=Limosa lapponica baueri TaxID=1758121 RepID=A0A2I0UEA1_LIMLA|nr:hypothetical protein llap_5344 [Limosa lapponica baueri]